ncbi:MAG: uL15 family ribosomal protein [Candidatus Aenigmarchaeota archaeon]|nr:uL15 family ribosomal protein [Candidatus Aenigmarchaeota archaeon]
MARKEKKTKFMRGLHTHGHGNKKKWRGGGSRGGRGEAGKYHHKKTWAMRWGKVNEKKGFTSIGRKEKKVINVGDIEDIAKQNYSVNLVELGYDKVLGSGNITKAIKVEAGEFSKTAKEKIEKAGGQAIQK